MERGIHKVAAVREAVGPLVDVAIDCRARLNIWSARRVPYDNAEAMGAFARSVNVPVSTGEQLYTR
ncbi:MAG TPA: hypothetical protein DIC52_01120 [Candidatus Latescibacteria bacterium]|nr:hypothetical protein [Candidatus Latescibacterota bacterium]